VLAHFFLNDAPVYSTKSLAAFMRTVLRVLARPVLHEPYSCNKPIGAKSHRSSTSDNFSGAFEVLDQVLSRYLRTEIENLHGRFLLNLNFMQQCPVQSIVNSMARVERITNGVCSTPEYRIRGGDFPASTANFFHQLATAVSACQPQRVQTSAQSPVWHSAVQAHGILSPLSVSRKGGGRGLVKTILLLTQVLVHSQLQVRGGVSLGQYHSTG
jgi:hypothetical protein